jgi:hypothetical protein
MHSEQSGVGDDVAHVVKIRDLRARFGEPEAYAAQCSCGWAGERREGPTGGREARRDGLRHAESGRVARPAESA